MKTILILEDNEESIFAGATQPMLRRRSWKNWRATHPARSLTT